MFMLEDFPKNSNEEEKSRIERIEEKLYSRTEEITQKDRTKLHPKKFFSMEDFEGGAEALRYEKKERPHRTSLYAVIFVVSLTFFVITGALAGFMIMNKKAAVSSGNVSISLFGPVSIGSGGILSLQVLLENTNTVPLENVDLSVEFPSGARYPNQPDKELEHFRKTLGVIAAGEVRTETIKAALFGEEKSIKDIVVTAKYRIHGSDAAFTKNKRYAVTLAAPAVTVKTELLKEAASGQEVVFLANIESNSPSPIKRTLLHIDYPQGFVFGSAVPAPSFGDNAWKLGEMAQGDHRQVEIKGIIHGEDAQEKVFRLFAGMAKTEDSPAFDTVFSSLLPGLVIKKPFLGVDVFVNGSADPNFVFDNENTKVDIVLKNNLPDKIIDGQIEVSLRGATVNKNTISPGNGGFYRSSDGVLFWDKRTFAGLSVIPAREKSAVSFSFNLLPLASGGTVISRNPEIEITVSVKGKRVSENDVPEEAFVQKKFKVATTLEFAGRSLYYAGPFPNTGPLPPKVQNETTYAILWTIRNTANDVSGGSVRAVLPPYVAWKDLVSPNGADIVYNPVSHEITWNIGTIKSGTGYEIVPQEVAFQVGLTPGLAQVGQRLPLISDATFMGEDDFTKTAIKRALTPLTTFLSTDPQFNLADGEVEP